MAKQYMVQIGGKERPIAFHALDAIALKKRFGVPVSTLASRDLLGMDENGRFSGVADLEVQLAFLTLGLKRASDKPASINEDKVIEWIDQHLKEEKPIGDLVWPCAQAVYISGILGQSVDIQRAVDEAKEKDEGAEVDESEEGKA